MLLSRTALLTLILSIGVLVGGALVVTTSKPERLSEKAGTAQNQN
ncbi:hypothetical protein [Arthrobacter sp. lap29]|nr:hypothetical protein [Arthrobacter sp. lap29]